MELFGVTTQPWSDNLSVKDEIILEEYPALDKMEFSVSVRVSFLELYTEETFNLLSAAGDTTRLKLYEGGQ